MTDLITVTGFIATIPNHLVTGNGLPITTFRLGSTYRRFDRQEQKWVDGDTNWFTVTAFRNLALNAAGSLEKGQRIIVRGRLRIRDWTKDERTGTNIEIDAESLGHDLAWGTARYTRNLSSSAPRDDAAAAVPGSSETEAAWATGPSADDEPRSEDLELAGVAVGDVPAPF